MQISTLIFAPAFLAAFWVRRSLPEKWQLSNI
jgi:hypothetical protein